LADIKCAHCGNAHAAGARFCPKTGKPLPPPAATKGTMIMFGPPGSPPPNGQSAPPTPARTPVNARVSTPGQVRVNTPAAAPLASPPRTTSPGTGTQTLGERLSRLTPGVGVRVPTVPAPPVTPDNVPPPLSRPASAGDTPEPWPPGQNAALPDWVADPEEARLSFASAVFPAVGAPAKGILDLLRDALKLYRRNARDFLLTAALLFVPAALVSSALLAVIGAPPGVTSVARLLGWAVVGLVLYATVLPLTLGALTVAVADRALGGDATPWDYWRLLVPHLAGLMSALAPAALLCALGYFLFLVPGLLLSTLFLFVPAIVLIEGLPGMAALRRSDRLVRADGIRVAVVTLAFLAIRLLAHGLSRLAIPGSAVFVEQLLAEALTLVLLPVPVLAGVLLYLDLRRRTEAFDTEALRSQLDTLRTCADEAPG
jgi:hypothetical protein